MELIVTLVPILLEKYGLGLLNLGVLLLVFWKLSSNHLYHLKLTVDQLDVKFDKTLEKMDTITEKVDILQNKVIEIDVRCGERHR